jgi:hypothetical protein
LCHPAREEARARAVISAVAVGGFARIGYAVGENAAPPSPNRLGSYLPGPA